MKHHSPRIAATIKTIILPLTGLSMPRRPARTQDAVAYAAALEVLG